MSSSDERFIPYLKEKIDSIEKGCATDALKGGQLKKDCLMMYLKYDVHKTKCCQQWSLGAVLFAFAATLLIFSYICRGEAFASALFLIASIVVLLSLVAYFIVCGYQQRQLFTEENRFDWISSMGLI